MARNTASIILAGILVLSGLAPATVLGQDLQSKIKYDRMRSHWHSQEVRQRIEAAKQRMNDARQGSGYGTNSSDPYRSSTSRAYQPSASTTHNYQPNNTQNYTPARHNPYASPYATPQSTVVPKHHTATTPKQKGTWAPPTAHPHLSSAPYTQYLPAYPGATYREASSGSMSGLYKNRTQYTYWTQDSPTQVYNFYNKAISDHGWAIKEGCTGQKIRAGIDSLNLDLTIDYEPVPSPGRGTAVKVDYAEKVKFDFYDPSNSLKNIKAPNITPLELPGGNNPSGVPSIFPKSGNN